MELEAMEAEYEASRKIVQFPTNKITSLRDLRNNFKNYRELYLEENDVKSVPPLTVAMKMQEHMTIVKVNDRLAVYNIDKGIYETRLDFFHNVIFWIEPSFSEAKSNQVIFHLKNMAKDVESTASRYLVPVKNGIYNKKTKKLEAFSNRYIFTSTIETEYIENIEAPNIDGWNVDDWLLDLMNGDESLVKLLWQVISASLNGNYSYRKSIWFVGEGNDGKGTLQQLISNLVGLQNVASLKINQFSERFTLSMIEGKTVIIGDDVQAGLYIDDSSNFNSVVTGEPVFVEEKGKQPYVSFYKKTVIQSTNGLPKVRNKTNGTYRRFLIIPFKKTFSAKDDNWAIKDDYIFREEVLQYVLKKAIELNFERFDEPQATKVMMQEFKEKNNSIIEFVNEWFPQFKSTVLPVRFLWWLYQEWCRDSGYTALAKRQFELEVPKHVSSEWEKKTTRPKEEFLPHSDIPNYYVGFRWDGEDKEKASKCFVKLLP
ncbi:DNA primase family protein [Lactococcus formosensis]|uniref:DNA primase family protein n=1 Tax=Lactococcus formosensis TaxID=1281486 RepID=UPI0022E8226A|nr:DNA primase family protein [Lactococcus formosensis]